MSLFVHMFINRQFFKYIHQTHLSFPVYLFLQANGPGRALVKTCDLATCLSLVQKTSSVISTFGCHARPRRLSYEVGKNCWTTTSTKNELPAWLHLIDDAKANVFFYGQNKCVSKYLKQIFFALLCLIYDRFGVIISDSHFYFPLSPKTSVSGKIFPFSERLSNNL